MTATRLLKGGTLFLGVALWLIGAAFLWRTKVPADLGHPQLDPSSYFSRPELHRADHYVSIGRLFFLLAIGVELVLLAALALLGRRLAEGFALGEIGSGVMIGVAASLFIWTATLPIAILGQWWDRRYGISKRSYGSFIGEQATGLGVQVAVVAIVLVILMLLARRFRRHWWAIAAPLFLMIGAIFVVVLALLAPLGTHPIRQPQVAAAVERLKEREHVTGTKVRVEEVSDDTRAVNAMSIGVGPTTVVVLWDTLFRAHLSNRAISFVAAHELGHVARRHIWKGLGWGLLFSVPLTFLLAEATRRRGGLHRAEVVPFALLVSSVLSLAATPLQNVVSRRYEAEADWMAVQATRDPAAGREAFGSFTKIDLAEPNPPLWSYVLLDDHPTVMQRLAMMRGWEIRTRSEAGRSPAGS
jgi:STE24 endopeptidase